MEYQISPVRAESVISKAAHELRRFVEARNLVAGDTLPPETQLSSMLGISRNSVREALRILDGLGFIEKRPGRRAVVRSRTGILANKPPDRADLVEGVPIAYGARMLIDQRCAELAAQRATAADLAELDGWLSRFEEALKRSDSVAAARAHMEFHATVVRAAGNPVLATMFEAVRFVIAEFAEVVPEVFNDRRLISHHRAIYRAIRERDTARAGAAVRRHFQANRPQIEFEIRARGEAPRTGVSRPETHRGLGTASTPPEGLDS
jgi:DNA-binding FadR family transcriptional regulator